jgi:hypothetical protein
LDVSLWETGWTYTADHLNESKLFIKDKPLANVDISMFAGVFLGENDLFYFLLFGY